MSLKIYTKVGDKGTTSLIGGTKVLKSDVRIEAYGTVDELNSYVGLCNDLVTGEQSKNILKEVQDRLFTIGSSLARDPQKGSKMKIPGLKEEDVSLLEREIDRMNEVLPEMKNFILPGGHATVSHIHVARCICRRAERCCVRLNEQAAEDLLILKYLNRLSDYLFVLARYTSHLLKVPETAWVPRFDS
jgi:cob(I)alamin adenosyltransferase